MSLMNSLVELEWLADQQCVCSDGTCRACKARNALLVLEKEAQEQLIKIEEVRNEGNQV